MEHEIKVKHADESIPENAKARLCAVGEATETKALASLKVSQNKSKVLHGHPIPLSEQTSVVRGRHLDQVNQV